MDLLLMFYTHKLDKRRLNSLQETLNTLTLLTGKLLFHIFGALAEFGRNLISARNDEGLDTARAEGIVGVRKEKLSKKDKKDSENYTIK